MNKLWQMRYLIFFVCCEECFKLTLPTKKIIHVKEQKQFPNETSHPFPPKSIYCKNVLKILQKCFENEAFSSFMDYFCFGLDLIVQPCGKLLELSYKTRCIVDNYPPRDVAASGCAKMMI